MTQHAHLPTLEQIMHRDPFELIDSPWGHIEAWRASTMATGTMGALAQVAAIVRNDAAKLQEKIAALDAKKSAVLNTVNRLLRFMSRVDALTARVEALEAKRRGDEEQQRGFEEEPLVLPPDLAERQSLAPPKKIGDETPASSGEIQAIAAKEEPSKDEPSELPEPPLETETTSDAGGVRLSYGKVPTSYVHSAPRDQAGDLPEELEQEPDPVPEPRGSV
jgi:hypothetical protein